MEEFTDAKSSTSARRNKKRGKNKETVEENQGQRKENKIKISQMQTKYHLEDLSGEVRFFHGRFITLADFTKQ